MKAKDIIGSRRITNEDGSGIVDAGKRLVGKKLVPVVGFTDAALRARDGDYIGAGLGTIAGGLGLVPPVPPYGLAAQAGSLSLDALNQLRDVAKERGGWGNLGRDLYQSIKTQEYDPSFLPENLEQLDEAGLRDLIMKYGPEAGTWLKNLVTRKKPDVPTPPRAPDVPPLSAAERDAIARAEEEAARRAEKEVKFTDRRGQPKDKDAPKDTPSATEPVADPSAPVKVPGKRPLESDRAYLQRLEKMGPEYVAKHRQDIDTLVRMRELELNAPKNIPIEIGKKLLKYGTIGGAAATGLKYGPDVVDWALDKSIKGIEDMDTTGAKLPFPAPAEQPPAPSNSTDSSDTATDKPAPAVPAAPEVVPSERPGVKMYGDQSRAPGKAEPLSEKQEQYSKKQYIAWATKYAKMYDVPLPVVLHAMRKETGIYDANTAATIRGPKTKYGQAVGVMQLMPTFFKTLKPEDFTNPEKNIEAGTRFLAKLYNTYGSAEAALAAYNAGPNNPKFTNWLKSQNPKDLPAQTREYIYGNPKKKTIGFVDNVDQQVALLAPETAKDKIARVATDVVAAATGSGNAQAANSSKVKTDNSPSAPQYPRAGTPIEQVARSGHYTNPILQPQDGRVHMQMQDLSSTFRAALDKALADYQKDNPGAKILVTSGARTIEDQKRLYNQAQAELAKKLRGEPNNYRVASAELAGHAGYAIDMNTPDLVKLTRWLKKNDPKGTKYNLRSGLDFNDDVHLELRNWQELDQARQKFNQKLPRNKQIATAAEWEEYNQRIEQEKLALAQSKDRKQQRDTDTRIAQAEPQKAPEKKAEKPADKIDPLTGARSAQAEPVDKPADKSTAKPAAKPRAPIEVPAVDDYGTVIEPGTITKPAAKPADKPANKTPKAKTYTTTDTQGKTTTYTQNEKGQWIDPKGNILPMPEKPGSKKDLSISDKGEEPSAADLEKARKITGRTDPIIDPQTGYPTTEKELKAKLEKQAAEKRAAADREANSQSDTSNKAVDKKSDRKADTSNQAPLVIPPGLKDRIAKDSNKRADANAPLVIPPKLKDRIDKDSKNKADANPPVVIPSELKNLEKNTARKDFEQAFKAARDEKGAGNTFNWTNPLTGKEGTYTTDYKQEKKNAQPAKTAEKPVEKTDQEFDTKSSSLVDKETDKKSDNKSIASPVDTNVIDALTKKDSWDTARNAPSIKIDLATGNATDKEATLSPVTVDAKPEKINVWRDSSGKPVTNRYGEPWGTGTSDKDDIEAAKIELQQQAEIDKAKGKLQAISPDLSKPPESSWKDMWNRGIENLTGKKRMSHDELNTIRVPESINNELDDILRLAGRKK